MALSVAQAWVGSRTRTRATTTPMETERKMRTTRTSRKSSGRVLEVLFGGNTLSFKRCITIPSEDLRGYTASWERPALVRTISGQHFHNRRHTRYLQKTSSLRMFFWLILFKYTKLELHFALASDLL